MRNEENRLFQSVLRKNAELVSGDVTPWFNFGNRWKVRWFPRSSVWGGHGRAVLGEPSHRGLPSAKLLFEIVVGRFQIGRAFHGAQGVDVTYHNWIQLA